MPRVSTPLALLPAVAGLAALGGCIVPFQTSAPPLSRTVGAGRVGVTVHSEFPTVDLLATQQTDAGADDPEPASFPVSSVQLHYGLGERLDLEAGIEAVVIGLPLPVGASIGLRRQLVDGRTSVAAALRGGWISGSSTTSVGSTSERYEAEVLYAQAAVAAQREVTPWFRPGLALAVAPSKVATTGGALGDFAALTVGASASATFVFGRLELGPAVNVGRLLSDNLPGGGVVVSGGLYLGVRPQRRAEVTRSGPPGAP
jgi:hypothetical protein